MDRFHRGDSVMTINLMFSIMCSLSLYLAHYPVAGVVCQLKYVHIPAYCHRRPHFAFDDGNIDKHLWETLNPYYTGIMVMPGISFIYPSLRLEEWGGSETFIAEVSPRLQARASFPASSRPRPWSLYPRHLQRPPHQTGSPYDPYWGLAKAPATCLIKKPGTCFPSRSFAIAPA